MRKQHWKQHPLRQAFCLLLGPALVLAVALLLFSALDSVRSTSSDEGQRLLSDSIQRAIVTCYASEGVYPPTLEHIEQRYGVLIDHDAYFVDYSAFADNIMPSFTVLARDSED